MPKAYEFNVRVLPMGLFACRFLEDQTIMYIHDGSQLGVLVFTQNKPRLLILENVFWQYFKHLLSWFSEKLKSKLGERGSQRGTQNPTFTHSCSGQVYLITLDARLIIHAITQFFHPIPVFTL